MTLVKEGLNMKEYEDVLIYTPGPVNVPQRVLAAGAQSMIHHRSAEFSAILIDLIAKLRWLFNTKAVPLLIHTSGRGAMEGTILNLFSRGDKIISVCNGRFGEMYAEIATNYGLNVVTFCEDWEKDLSPEELEKAIIQNPDAKAVTLCHGDTSTARLIDIPPITAMAKKHGLLTLVDCVSTAGCIPIDFDSWNADVIVTASQKGLMSPTGLSIAFLSEAAWKHADTSALGKFYIDFKDIRAHLEAAKPETPGSTPVSLIRSLNEALSMMQEEGREAIFARHAKLACAVRAGLTEMGMTLFPVECKARSNALTTFIPPDGVSPGAIKNGLKEQFGIMIAGGLGSYTNSTLRAAHMGYFYSRDALLLVSAMETVLNRILSRKASGKGIAACMDLLSGRS